MSYQADDKILYKYCSAQTALNILSNNMVRTSSPKCFNDPYDCYAPSPISTGWRELSSKLANIVGGPRGADLIRLVDTGDSAIDSSEEGRDIQSGLYKHAVLCLSAEPSHPLMWAHYSDHHKGVVLGIRASKKDDSVLRLARPVKYLGDLTADDNIINTTPMCWMYTKPMCWKYEDEWRIVLMDECRDEKFYDLYIRDSEIVEINFGCRFQENESDVIKKFNTILPSRESLSPLIYNSVQNRTSYDLEKVGSGLAAQLILFKSILKGKKHQTSSALYPPP